MDKIVSVLPTLKILSGHGCIESITYTWS